MKLAKVEKNGLYLVLWTSLIIFFNSFFIYISFVLLFKSFAVVFVQACKVQCILPPLEVSVVSPTFRWHSANRFHPAKLNNIIKLP